MRKFLTLVLLLLLCACQSESRNQSFPRMVELITPSGEKIKTILAITLQDQERGLSGMKSEDFANDQGMLFFYMTDDEKNFWMPDTYFDLDLIYLDRDLKIVDIIRKLPHYVGRANPALIPRARPVWSRHTLEMKAGSKISGKLKVGDQLQWDSPMTLQQIESKIRQQQ